MKTNLLEVPCLCKDSVQGIIIVQQTPHSQSHLSVLVDPIETSNKKHFMKNVKECRDVIVKKVSEQGWDTRTTHYTHVGPMTPYIVVINYMTCIACLCKQQPDLL